MRVRKKTPHRPVKRRIGVTKNVFVSSEVKRGGMPLIDPLRKKRKVSNKWGSNFFHLD